MGHLMIKSPHLEVVEEGPEEVGQQGKQEKVPEPARLPLEPGGAGGGEVVPQLRRRVPSRGVADACRGPVPEGVGMCLAKALHSAPDTDASRRSCRLQACVRVRAPPRLLKLEPPTSPPTPQPFQPRSKPNSQKVASHLVEGVVHEAVSKGDDAPHQRPQIEPKRHLQDQVRVKRSQY